MDLNILKQIIILKLTIWFYRRQWMRERGGEGERERFKCYTIVFHVCYEKLQLWITIMDYTGWHDLG